MTSESASVVRVENVTKEVRPGLGLRRVRILDGISLDVRQGEIFGFVGPNGAGKTTTLMILMGLARATTGRATILGRDVREPAARRSVGFLPENPYFYDYLSGRETLHFYAALSGVPACRRSERVAELLDWVGLAGSADLRLRTYSKGMKQRVGIAQALVHDPQVVMLDEPMSGLDPIGRKQIRDLILRLRDEGKTVFMNTHILSDVEMLCDRVAIIVDGRIRHQGRTAEFLVGDEQECEVVVSGLPVDASAQLEQRFGACLRGQDDHLLLRVAEKDVDALLRMVLAAQGRIVAVSPQRVSLESIFLSAVRGERA